MGGWAPPENTETTRANRLVVKSRLGMQAPRQGHCLQVLRFSNCGRAACAATKAMERNVTKPVHDYPKHPACQPSSHHGPSPAEIQRWEDDGGAIPTARKARRRQCDPHLDYE